MVLHRGVIPTLRPSTHPNVTIQHLFASGILRGSLGKLKFNKQTSVTANFQLLSLLKMTRPLFLKILMSDFFAK